MGLKHHWKLSDNADDSLTNNGTNTVVANNIEL